MTPPSAISLFELNSRVGAALSADRGLSNVWVVAETSDLRVASGHCYMELIEKDSAGTIRARARATIWASQFVRINAAFSRATGSPLASDIKVMVKASVSYHPIYGISLNITDVNPEFTLGDLLRRRREMIARLQSEGIIDENRNLPWPDVPLRVAVISAAGAAGYGDFINQLYSNSFRLRFHTRLFQAVMQGDRAPSSIIAALEQVALSDEDFDCVVLIRGGGATGDLAAFDNYELAACIALFPLPVVIGIGHERDITLLDYVANTRVKTPTAAAELLIGRGAVALERLRRIGSEILDRASAAINASHRKLDNAAGRLPLLAANLIDRHKRRIGKDFDDSLRRALDNVVARRADRLKAFDALIAALSPEATLRRGFSITRVDGHAVTSPDQLRPGDVISTTLATGEVQSSVISQ